MGMVGRGPRPKWGMEMGIVGSGSRGHSVPGNTQLICSVNSTQIPRHNLHLLARTLYYHLKGFCSYIIPITASWSSSFCWTPRDRFLIHGEIQSPIRSPPWWLAFSICALHKRRIVLLKPLGELWRCLMCELFFFCRTAIDWSSSRQLRVVYSSGNLYSKFSKQHQSKEMLQKKPWFLSYEQV